MITPVIDGIHQGTLVEIVDGDDSGEIGQYVAYKDGAFQLAMLGKSGLKTIDPKLVRACTGLEQPGEGGDETSFDMVIGPGTREQVLGQSMANCLHRKGFCVLKMIQDLGDLKACIVNLETLVSNKSFKRLPQKVEDGYLGKSGRAKTMWMGPSIPEDDLLWTMDGTMTSIATALVPFQTEKLGFEVGERTSGMLCLSMQDEEEDEYLHPEADSQTLLEYHDTWSRGKIKVVLFMGPDAGEVTLVPKEDAPISGLSKEYTICASANTIVIMREDTFTYAYDEPDVGESAWLQSFLLEPRAEWAVQEFEEESLSTAFAVVHDGPPPPQNLQVSVTSLHLHAAANMVDTSKEWCAYISGSDGQLEMPASRFDYKPYYTEDNDNPAGMSYVKHFSVLEGIDMFDPKVFDMSTSEANAMDPMYRQVCEISHVVLNKVGITKKYTNGNPIHASVSVGNDKQEWVSMTNVPSSVATNNQLAIAANRINYIFNLKGGSYVCDTACSSSLVAAHMGKLALLEQRWDPLEFHLAMGVGLTLTVFSFIGSCASHMLSPLGRCLTFNASANGYNRGDGCAGMMLQNGPREDQRYAYFRGSQMGNDGRSASMSAPNGPAQEKCIWGAVREAQMRPPESTVWECHGTGTSLGDPIEVGAVRKVMIKDTRLEPLMIGTSKSNIGHLEGTAAIVAMVKCVVLVYKSYAPPTIHFRTLNPHLEHTSFDGFFCSETNPYRYARGHSQVSSFGVGGTNGHAVFWGETLNLVRDTPDYKELAMKKLDRYQTSIKAEGLDPASWTLSGLGMKAKPGEKYQVVLERDFLTDEQRIRFVKPEEEEDVAEPPKEPEFFSILGNFSDWTGQRMEDDSGIPGLFVSNIDIPPEGMLQFRFMVEDNTKRAFGPVEENTTRRNVKMTDESANCRTYWTVVDDPGVMYRVELMVPAKGPKTVNWFLLTVED